MLDKLTVVDFAFKESIGIDFRKAIELLKNKGINFEDIDTITEKYLNHMDDDIEKYDIPDEYRILFHIVIIYLILKSSLKAYNEVIDQNAKDLGLSPKKYKEIMYKFDRD